MASTINDLLACRGFGEAVEEWDLRSQQSDGPPANKDGACGTKEQNNQHEIVQDNKKHTESALQDNDRGHTASVETRQGSKETPTAGTVTRASLRRAQLQVNHQGKQNPHSEQGQKTPDQQGVPQHLHTGWRWEWCLEPWWPR